MLGKPWGKIVIDNGAFPLDDKLTIRIRALLAKTVDRGCTEAEALAAAAKAKKLMDEIKSASPT